LDDNQCYGYFINGPLGGGRCVYVKNYSNLMKNNLNKNWELFPLADENFIEKNKNLNKTVLQLLYNRGLVEEKVIESFLNPDYQKSFDPFLFNEINKAVELVIKHIKEGNKILIYGDYDADGVTSSAVLFETLNLLKGNVSVYIPDRVSEGYGLNQEAISEANNNGVKLIITVDNGIRNKEEAGYAKSLNIDVIVTDHHLPPHEKNELPECIIINPMANGENYPFKLLAGVGVAFKLAKAIILTSTLKDDDKKRLEEKILDLVAIGTIADCVSLTGENRILTKKGLEIINNSGRIGLKALIEAAEINNGKKLDSWNISFQIAPRLNAAGRMDHANTAFELLTTKDAEEAKIISHWLNERNYERQKTTEEIVNFIVNEVEKNIKEKKQEFIIIAVAPEDKEWNEGVVGLVAGKISDKYYRPVIVLTKGENGLKGSGRSIAEFSIIGAVEECAELLIKFGGHKQACGLSLKKENLQKFKEKIGKIAEEKLSSVDLSPKLLIESEIDLCEINESLVEEINKFSPFGQGNDRPKLLSKNCVVVDKISMGFEGQHLKIKLKKDNSLIISAVGFGQAEQWKDIMIGDKIDIVYYIEMNEFNGRREAQIKIVDIKINIEN